MKNSPFHDSNANPLPDADDIERRALDASDQTDIRQHYVELSEEGRRQFEADKKRLRNWFVGLLLTGLLIGGVLAVGLVWTMNRLNLTNPPPLHQQR